MRLRPGAVRLSLPLVLCACDTLPRSGSPGTPPSRVPPAAAARQADTSRAEVRLLRGHGWTPLRILAEDSLQLPVPATHYLSTKRYLEASEMIGLDFSRFAGRKLRVVTYGVEGRSAPEGSVRAHLLYDGPEVVGAWLSVEDRTPGIYSLDVDPYSL
ncbi:MAG TPA: DUF4830 domain-containing protein [Longimicrobiaceae bacterium]|nr:DUF4830 domain-containing protein [Longimicrobiaceae bacterium]